MPSKKTDKQGGLGILDRQKNEYKKPRKFKCVMYNDDFTPMDIVTAILVQVFLKPTDEAFRLTMQVHEQGKGIAGIYSREVAESKCDKAVAIARQLGYPFKVMPEPE